MTGKGKQHPAVNMVKGFRHFLTRNHTPVVLLENNVNGSPKRVDLADGQKTHCCHNKEQTSKPQQKFLSYADHVYPSCICVRESINKNYTFTGRITKGMPCT